MKDPVFVTIVFPIEKNLALELLINDITCSSKVLKSINGSVIFLFSRKVLTVATISESSKKFGFESKKCSKSCKSANAWWISITAINDKGPIIKIKVPTENPPAKR